MMQYLSVFLLSASLLNPAYGLENPYKANLSISSGSLFINEFMASNKNTSIPGFSGYEDWIEIYNSSSSDIDISGYYITDNLSNPTKRQLPVASGSVIVPANGYLVLICSGDPGLGSHHIDLGLSASGEEIGLFRPDQTLVDSIVFGPQLSDVSMGRNPTNLSEWRYFNNPTPGSSNNLTDSFAEILSKPAFSHSGGVYTSAFDLSLSTDVSGATIYYTLDGSEPDPDNLSGKNYYYKNEPNGYGLYGQIMTYKYTGSSINIYDRSMEDNQISMKSSTFQKQDGKFNYYFPDDKITKGTVVRAMIRKDGINSDVATHTFFVFNSEDRYSFPIVSISIDENNLFDYNEGIYTGGSDGYHNYEAENPKGNYNRNTRYPGNFEYIVNGEQKLSEVVDYRIHGGSSRSLPQKSLNVYAKGKFNYPFFDKYPERLPKNLILRNGGQGWNTYNIKDLVCQQIMEKLHFGIQEGTPAISFLNGEYWGILNIREKLNEHYLNEVYGVDKDEVDIIKITFYNKIEVSEGDREAYDNLISFVNSTDFSIEANYDSLLNLIDINSFIDYHIAETFLGNYDWLFNNIRLWRSKVETFDPDLKGYNDGRWRWLMYDTDLSYSASENMLKKLRDSNDEGAKIFKKIWNNGRFKEAFSVRYSDLLNTHLTSARIEGLFDYYNDLYDHEIDEHISRWTRPTNWPLYTNYVKNNVVSRIGEQKGFLRSFYSLGSDYKLTVDVSNTDHGYIKVNTIDVLPSTPGISENTYPWEGNYFENTTTTLTAESYNGYRFKRWLKDGTNYSSSVTITFNLDSDQNYTAVFETYTLSDHPFPIAKVIDECGYIFNSWPSSSTEGAYPENMSFVYFLKSGNAQKDHFLGDDYGGLYELNYKGDKKSRINGLNNDGVAFINTGSDFDDIPQATLGGAILALNTFGQDSVFISWKGSTVLPNDRKYRIRLQYRIGDVVAFSDLLDSKGKVIEYKRNKNAGHSEYFEDILLPEAALNQPYIQLLWRYYHGGSETSGPRAQLSLDDIQVRTSKSYTKGISHGPLTAAYGKIDSKATIEGVTEYKSATSIVLSPGFNTKKNVFFKAEVNKCTE